jgi:pantoate--beta-alanine ligase
MKIAGSIQEVQKQIRGWKKEGFTIGFVPTMGYLHAGHQSLIKEAASNDKVVVSIFVNPIQFGPKEDYASYPRNFGQDCIKCQEAGTDLVFHPEPEEMYPKDFCSYADMDGLTKELCGLSRPLHFRGVCTVVLKLFHIVQPDRAYFGQKDAQQLAVIRKMVRDFNLDIEVVGCPIIREADGLAKSYRNEEERKAARVLSQAIKIGEQMVDRNGMDTREILCAMQEHIRKEPLARIDYIKAVDANSIIPVERIKQPVLFAIAVYIGKTRLIDNFISKEVE